MGTVTGKRGANAGPWGTITGNKGDGCREKEGQLQGILLMFHVKKYCALVVSVLRIKYERWFKGVRVA